VCVDDLANVAELSAAAEKHGTSLECFVEIDCGAGRCGVNTTAEVVAIARAIDAAPGLKFAGIQAYQGAMQHLERYEDRKAKLDAAIAQVKEAVEALKKEGLEPEPSVAAARAATILRAARASTMSSNAAATPSWTPIMAASSTRTGSVSTRESGKTRSSS
jgi:D-serine deaminase-like pyridoxal phosphate-dependent protein